MLIVCPIVRVTYRETNNIYTQKDYNNRDQDPVRQPSEHTLTWHLVTETDGRVSTLSLGTPMGDLQASLELPQTSWDVSQGGSQLLLTLLSVTLPSFPDREFVALTSADDYKLRILNSNTAGRQRHRQRYRQR